MLEVGERGSTDALGAAGTAGVASVVGAAVVGKGTDPSTGATAGGASTATGGGSELEVGSGTSSTDSIMTSSPGAVSVVVLMLTPPKLGSGLGGARSYEDNGTSRRFSPAAPSTLVGRDGSRETPLRRVLYAAPSYSTWTVARCAAFRLRAAALAASLSSSASLGRLDWAADELAPVLRSSMLMSSVSAAGGAAAGADRDGIIGTEAGEAVESVGEVGSYENGRACAATNSVCVVGGDEVTVYWPDRRFGFDAEGIGTGRREADDTEVVDAVRERGCASSSTAPEAAGVGSSPAELGSGGSALAGGCTTCSKPFCGRGAETGAVAAAVGVTMADRCRCCDVVAAAIDASELVELGMPATIPAGNGPSDPIELAEV